jgi:hypothetical protein
MKHSLVSWLTGEDQGKMSVVESNCVRGYEWMKFDADGKPLEKNKVVVEWRAGKRNQKTGWPLYDARLIQVSSKCKAY